MRRIKPSPYSPYSRRVRVRTVSEARPSGRARLAFNSQSHYLIRSLPLPLPTPALPYGRASDTILIDRNHAEIEHRRQSGAKPHDLWFAGRGRERFQDQIDSRRDFDRDQMRVIAGNCSGYCEHVAWLEFID